MSQICLLWRFHIDGLIWHMIFCVWLLSLSIMFLRFINFASYISSLFFYMVCKVKELVSHSTLCGSKDWSPSGFSDHGIFQGRVLEWVAIHFFSGSSQLRDWIWVSCIVGISFTIWNIREAPFIVWVYRILLTHSPVQVSLLLAFYSQLFREQICCFHLKMLHAFIAVLMSPYY